VQYSVAQPELHASFSRFLGEGLSDVGFKPSFSSLFGICPANNNIHRRSFLLGVNYCAYSITMLLFASQLVTYNIGGRWLSTLQWLCIASQHCATRNPAPTCPFLVKVEGLLIVFTHHPLQIFLISKRTASDRNKSRRCSLLNPPQNSLVLYTRIKVHRLGPNSTAFTCLDSLIRPHRIDL
jgi:hypothetical protein